MFDRQTVEFGFFNGFVLSITPYPQNNWTLRQWERDILTAPVTNTKPSIISLQPEKDLCLFSNGAVVWAINKDWQASLLPEIYQEIILLGAYEGKGLAVAVSSAGESGIVKID